jgi:uncharacterized protein YdhG (YjbR/CyaY superfamily)
MGTSGIDRSMNISSPEAQEMISYQKGAVQFPLDAPLPTKLIKAIVKFRVKEATMPC